MKSCNLILGRVDSPYFDNNPGAAENMPGMARLMRTLTTDECGRLIARLAEHPRYEVAYPFMLRLNAWLHRLAPGFVNWLLRISGAKRHQSAGSA